MQKSVLSIKSKLKILLGLASATLLISIPLGLETLEFSEGIYYAIHVASVILGSSLSIIGIITYLEFRNARLAMVFSAFLAITIAEGISLVNLVFPFFETTYDIHDLITHGLILLMLSFFIVGVFRSD